MLSLLSPGAHSQNATQNKMINNSAHTVVNNQNSSSKLTYRKNVLYAGAAARGTQISQGAAASDSEPKKQYLHKEGSNRLKPPQQLLTPTSVNMTVLPKSCVNIAPRMTDVSQQSSSAGATVSKLHLSNTTLNNMLEQHFSPMGAATLEANKNTTNSSKNALASDHHLINREKVVK